ncbi:MAG: alpha/beta hydrolase [Methylotenera sp.]|nr:alpha/beta hydrolase [Methylotenera sp.]MDP1959485.1 alpha/beta hydrolase [Methylotenera sp.]MDP3302948.1 alpha/beta hydrolase [Methylotenera sp.]MDP3943715.1 alpha/beta hydrolase [Methylotenera sp.]
MNGMSKMLSSLLTILVLAYGSVAVLLFLMQDKLAYYPQIGREIQTTPREHGLDYEALTLATSDGERLDAWFVPARGQAVVLILHGNAGNISHRMDSIAMFHRLGYGVLIFDYRGYGRSSGKPSEEGLYRDAQTAWDHLTRQRGIAPAHIILFGESLGGAVAAWLASREKPGALALSSVLTSAPELGADLYPWLPAKWLVRMRYDTLATMAQVSCPVLIAHSPDDEIIPFRHGQRLFDAAAQPKAFLPLTGGHNDSFIFMRQEWMDVLAGFLSQHIENKTPSMPPF